MSTHGVLEAFVRSFLRLGSCVAIVALGACGGSGIEGEYFWGEDGDGITLELAGDGVATVTLSGLSATEGTYAVDGDRVTVVMADGDIDIYRVVDGNLTITAFGDKLVFVKQ
ncbi:MAG TPA: hypothetical protein VLD39_06185 [Gammaproteobacteria bacterium]|nr:hypothetical protein [Gammaproteobacteria bacterium]